MKRFKLICLVIVLLSVFLLLGCSRYQANQTGSESSSDDPRSASIEPIESQEAEPKESEAQSDAIEDQPEESEDQLKEANWVIEINDTQQITDEMGLIWNYTLTMYASKAGGEDILGAYSGEIVLNMEPDFDSAKALAAREGAELLAMLFKHHSEAKEVSFQVVAYSQEAYADLMKENSDNPLLQFNPDDSADGLAIDQVTFKATQEPIDMTIKDDGETISGTVPGRQVTVTVPMEITMDGATVYCYFHETVHPLSRAFKGVITGDVVE